MKVSGSWANGLTPPAAYRAGGRSWQARCGCLQTVCRPFLVHCRGHRPRESACNTTADNCRFKCFHWLFLPFCCAAPYGLYTPACCFTNQKTPLPCCVRSRIREYFLCAACQVWLFREHFSASIASTTISAQRASLGSATSMVYVSVQFQSSLAICATVHQFQGFEKDVIMQFSTVNPICLFTKRICSRQTKAFTLQAPA